MTWEGEGGLGHLPEAASVTQARSNVGLDQREAVGLNNQLFYPFSEEKKKYN